VILFVVKSQDLMQSIQVFLGKQMLFYNIRVVISGLNQIQASLTKVLFGIKVKHEEF
jgi:hypothetical protein